MEEGSIDFSYARPMKSHNEYGEPETIQKQIVTAKEQISMLKDLAKRLQNI